MPLLDAPFCCTTTFPGEMLPGTVSTICVSLQLVTADVAAACPNFTYPQYPRTAPKPVPVRVTCMPGAIAVGEMLVKVGATVVYVMPLLDAPFCCTTTFPGEMLPGTVSTICV